MKRKIFFSSFRSSPYIIIIIIYPKHGRTHHFCYCLQFLRTVAHNPKHNVYKHTHARALACITHILPLKISRNYFLIRKYKEEKTVFYIKRNLFLLCCASTAADLYTWGIIMSRDRHPVSCSTYICTHVRIQIYDDGVELAEKKNVHFCRVPLVRVGRSIIAVYH